MNRIVKITVLIVWVVEAVILLCFLCIILQGGKFFPEWYDVSSVGFTDKDGFEVVYDIKRFSGAELIITGDTLDGLGQNSSLFVLLPDDDVSYDNWLSDMYKGYEGGGLRDFESVVTDDEKKCVIADDFVVAGIDDGLEDEKFGISFFYDENDVKSVYILKGSRYE